MEPSTHRELIDALGGNTVVAGEIEGCTPVRVGQWKIGDRIPVEYWPDIIRIAKDKALDFVTSDWLMNTMRPRQSQSGTPSPSEAA